jgi:hypothetical protein
MREQREHKAGKVKEFGLNLNQRQRHFAPRAMRDLFAFAISTS